MPLKAKHLTPAQLREYESRRDLAADILESVCGKCFSAEMPHMPGRRAGLAVLSRFSRPISRRQYAMTKTKKEPLKLVAFDVTRYLGDDEAIAEYLTAMLEANDPDLLLIALSDVIRAKGMPQMAAVSDT